MLYRVKADLVSHKAELVRLLESLRTHDFAGRRRLHDVIIDDDVVHRATLKLIVKQVTWTSTSSV